MIRPLRIMLGAAFGATSCVGSSAQEIGPQPVTNCALIDVNGQTIDGRWMGLAGDAVTIRPDSGAEVVTPLADLIRIRFDRAPHRPPKDATLVELVGGDRLVGTIESTPNDETLNLSTTVLGTMTLNLMDIHSIVFRPDHSRLKSLRGDVDLSAGADSLLLDNGDVLTGFISRVDPDSVTILMDDHPHRLAADLVRSVRFATDRRQRGGGLRLAIQFADTNRITLDDAQADGEMIRGTWFDAAIDVKLGDVRDIRVIGGRWAPIGEHDLLEHQHTPLVSARFEHRFKRSVMGGGIRVAGETFDHGIGVHSPSSLAFSIPDGADYFMTQFGLDDSAGPLAGVSVHIRVDGRDVFAKTVTTNGQLLGPVRLPVRGCSKLELMIEPGVNLTVQDCFDWIEPGFVLSARKSPQGDETPGVEG